MLILVINSGSSSLKYQLFDMKRKKPAAKGLIQRIGERNGEAKSHDEAIGLMVRRLLSSGRAAIKGLKDIAAIGHRVVHGGEEFVEAVFIDERAARAIRRYSALAPLHNPPALSAIQSCKRRFGNIPQVAVFDTAFHQTMPRRAYLYGLPRWIYKKHRVRRYGFHGMSHNFVAKRASGILKRPLKKLRLITCHLGNGCSMTAIEFGKSVDTSMGFTPLEGLVMGTRTGDMDPAIIFFLMDKEKFSAGEVSELLNKKSGIAGISGISNDMRDVVKAAAGGCEAAQDAIDVFVYRVRKYIGAYAAILGKVDALVFTAGIGENQPRLRALITRGLRRILGKAKILVIPTNEELEIASETYDLIKKRRR